MPSTTAHRSAAIDSGVYTAAWTCYYAGWVDKLEGQVVPVYGADALDYAVPEPYGVIGAIVPWNGPMMGMGQKVVPALAAGNTVVTKPPEIAPFGALMFAELALEAGLPPGVCNVVPGGAVAGQALVRHPGVNKVSFTGGVETARAVIAAAAEHAGTAHARARRQVGEHHLPGRRPRRGGVGRGDARRSPVSGQGCALPTRCYVHDDVYDDVVARIVAQVTSVPVGDPLDPAVLMGPVVTEAACERILGVIERAASAGAGTLLTGGERLVGAARRWLLRRADRVR